MISRRYQLSVWFWHFSFKEIQFNDIFLWGYEHNSVEFEIILFLPSRIIQIIFYDENSNV